MLPEVGTPERDALEQEAHDVAMRMLKKEFGNIPNALYRTYMHFRDRFLAERPHEFSEVMVDARQLEALVVDDWAHAIQERAQDANNVLRG